MTAAQPYRHKYQSPDKVLTRIPVQTEPDPDISHSHPAYDVVVAQRPKYIPNSGPPLTPIGIMPPHDKDGIIEQMFTLDGTPQYIVTFEENPWLRLSVKPENICKYVSARTLEDWEWKQTQLRTQMEEEELEPKVKARLEKQRLKGRKASETETSSHGDEEDVKSGKPGRPAKNKQSGAKLGANRKLSSSGMGAGIAMSMMAAPSPGGPGRRKREAEEAVYASPKRPTLSTPSKQQRGLADAFISESEYELEDSAALDRQLNGSPLPFPSKSKTRKQNSQFATTSNSSPLSTRTRSPEKRIARSSRSYSMTSSELAEQDSHGNKRRRMSYLEDSVASISSRTAFQQYEELESKAKNKEANYFKDRYSTLAKQQQQNHPVKIMPPKFSSSNPNRQNPAPAIPSRLRESRSSSGDQSPAPLRRSSRSSSGASSRGPQSASTPKSGRPARAASVSINYSIPSPIHLPLKTQPQPEEEDNDDEYDVKAILDEEWRTVKGKEVKYYKIRWEGEWDDTWEPEQNVGVEIIKQWRMQLLAERKNKMKVGAVEVDSGSE